MWPVVYPEIGYVPDQNCVWNLTVADGYFLDLWIEMYQIAKGDIVEVEDGATNQRILETDADDSIIFVETKRNSILIRFITDSAFNGTGFNVTYEAVLDPAGGVGSDLSIAGYFETTGGTTANYGNDVDDQWIVEAPTGSTFLVDAQMGSGGIHASDSLMLMDTVQNETMVSSATGLAASSLTQLLTNSNTFKTDFLSDSSATSTGFKVTFREWSSGFVGCSGVQTLSGPSGSFSSENYPTGRYSNNLDCSWLITVTSGQNIWLTLIVGTLEPINDVVTIYDGTDTNATVLFQSSDSNFAIPLMSTGNSVFVSFVSDGPYKVGTGFQVSYKEAQLLPSLSYLGSQSVPDWDFTVTHGSTLIDAVTGNVLLVPTSDLSEGVMWAFVVCSLQRNLSLKIFVLFQPLNLTDFYVDLSADISSSGTTTNGVILNIATNSSTASDLSDQVITSSGIYNTNWAGFTVGLSPVSSSLSLSGSLEGNSTSQVLGWKGSYANLRTQLRLAISVTNGTQISVCFFKQSIPFSHVDNVRLFSVNRQMVVCLRLKQHCQ